MIETIRRLEAALRLIAYPELQNDYTPQQIARHALRIEPLPMRIEFIGYQFSNVQPPFALFNANLGYGQTTVGIGTLRRHGIEVPPHPSPEEWQAIGELSIAN